MRRLVALCLLLLAAPLAWAQSISRPPEVLTSVSPVYPDSALQYGVSARVEVRARVDASGAVVSVRVLQGAGAAFDSAAVDAVRLWRFRPGLQNGRPVAAWVRLPVQFSPEYLVQTMAVGEASRIERMSLPADVERGEIRDGQISLGPGSLQTSGFSLRPETCSGRFEPHTPVTAPVSGLGLTEYFVDDITRGIPSARSIVSQLLVSVDADGFVTGVGLARATGLILDERLRGIVRQWTFQPARCDGARIAARAILTLNLRNRSSVRLYQAPERF